MKKVKRNKLVASAMILGIATGSVITLPFSHASLTAYAADAVSTESDAIKQVRELGLMTGGTQGDFMADKVLTRAETAKILSLIFQLDTSPQQMTSFMDVSSTAWSASYIEAVREAGFMGGDGELFRPNDAVTRADLISILVRSMELHADDSSVDAQTPVDIARSYGLSVVEASENLNAPLNREHGAEFFLQLLDHPVGEVVTDGNTVRIGNIPYQIGSTLQGLLGVENGNVLKGAKLDLNRSLRTVTGINTLELNGNGGTLDGAGATFNGKLIINGSVTVKNLTSTGELEIRGTDSVEAILDNSSLSKVTIIAKDAKLTATGTTRLEQLALDSNATLLTQGEAFINRLSLLQGLSKLFINGTIGELDTTGYNGTPFITLQERALIQQLRLDPNKLPSDVVINYNVMKQAVSGLNGNTNPDQTQVVTPPDTSSSRPKPNNGNNGGGNSGNESPAVDRVVLETTITHAGSLLNRAGEGGPDRNLYPQVAKDSLGSAIELAIGVLNNNQANQATVNEAVLQLNTAIQNYLGSAVQQGLIDLTALDQQLRISTESMLPENDNELPRVWNDYLQMAILDAQQVLVNSNTTQADVDAATTQLAKKTKLYMASISIKLPALQLLNAINSLPDLDFTDADRFKPTAFQAMLVYANTASSLEELQMTASQVQAMYDEYLLIQSVNFKALNVKLHEVGELTELHPADVVLSDMLNFYTKKMHKAMTQPEVDGILHELTSKLSNWSDINNPGEQVDTLALSQLVNTIAESLNSEPYLSSIMPLEYQTMDSLLSNSIDMYQPGSTSSQQDIDQQYTALEQGYFLFKEQLADKKLEYRQQLDLLIQQATDVLSTQSGNMSALDESHLNELLIYAQQAYQIDSAALFTLHNAVTDLSNGLEQVQILDKAALLTILDQAKSDYDAYGKYHPSSQTLYMAIENANTELADGYITQESIDEARLSLADALDNFQSPWITQMMIDDTLEQAILFGDQYSSGAESESQEYIALVTAIFEMQSLEDAESFEATLSQYVALKKSIEEFEVFLSNQGSNNSGGIPGDDPGVPFTSDEAVQSTDNPPADPVNPTPPVEESSQGDDNVTGDNDGASNSEVPSEPETSEPEATEPEAPEPIQDGSEPAVENSNENSNAPEANPADQDAEQGAEQEQGIPGGDSDFGIPG
ncbi:S-layer homology domain-containing protein [Paenibacillus massiliensis]|uniref:S-layer homology domain-containing protein n=1 Tax=Paenibacillus massiliensis TaxID=225917 RepID=UPI000382DEC1|nr:S-layer homology domain-containing protein [Paenibacillus massiliensis]